MSTTTPDPAQLTPAPDGERDHDNRNGDPRPSSSAEPTWDAASRGAALQRAQAVMTRFARRDLDAEAWWTALQPFLSDQAQQDYLDTDPTQVPVHRITGPLQLVPPNSTRIARVHVPTDAGPYLILMSRTPADPTWRVEQITPPEPGVD